jgi:hypothetical protein
MEIEKYVENIFNENCFPVESELGVSITFSWSERNELAITLESSTMLIEERMRDLYPNAYLEIKKYHAPNQEFNLIIRVIAQS